MSADEDEDEGEQYWAKVIKEAEEGPPEAEQPAPEAPAAVPGTVGGQYLVSACSLSSINALLHTACMNAVRESRCMTHSSNHESCGGSLSVDKRRR